MKKVYKTKALMGELLRPVSDQLKRFGILLFINVSVCRLTLATSKFVNITNTSNQLSTSGDAFKHLFRLRFYSNSNLLETTISQRTLMQM